MPEDRLPNQLPKPTPEQMKVLKDMPMPAPLKNALEQAHKQFHEDVERACSNLFDTYDLAIREILLVSVFDEAKRRRAK